MIDLRSDTVTQPSEEMKKAMFSAPLGDDVYGEDPTTNQLEEKAASIFGKEMGLFCTSGTMANQIAIKCHTQPMDQVICDKSAHVYNYEGGGIAFNSGASVKLLEGDRGVFTADDILTNIQPDNIHHPQSSLVVLENTSNRGGGRCWPLKEVANIAYACQKNNLKLHLDGARVFNALVAQNEQAADHGRYFDSISVCLSKGLGAPIGSLLLGDAHFIKKARRVRKILGGGMRQVGFLAAAGIYALDNNIERLAEDHEHAQNLATRLADLNFVQAVLPVETNIVIFKLKNYYMAEDLLAALEKQGILCHTFSRQMIRMVTHLGVNRQMIDKTIKTLKKLDKSILTVSD